MATLRSGGLPKTCAPDKTGLVHGSWFSVLGRSWSFDDEPRTRNWELHLTAGS
jgi:hypothetical protein